MHSITLQRAVGKRTNDVKILKQLEKIIARGVGGTRRTWTGDAIEVRSPYQITVNQSVSETRNYWVFTYRLEFTKASGRRGGEAEYRQWEEIKAMVEQTGSNAAFNGQNWTVIAWDDNDNQGVKTAANGLSAIHQNPAGTTPEGPIVATEGSAEQPIQPADFTTVVGDINDVITQIMGIREVQSFGVAKTWEELHVPPELLGEDSDRHLAEHPAWKNLYGVNPQIRIVLSNIKRAQETNGESRNHGVLFGHAGCGKTTTMFALEQMFGKESVLKLDATSTTKAGLEKLFFNDLTSIPPLVFMEEAEKADPEALKIWLGALDDRGEIRKINFRVNHLRQVKVLFICSVNNKTVFDRMMGSDGTEAGALSSRCVTQVYYPRPSEAVLFQILDKEIREKGGSHEWIAPAIQIAQELGVTDPRTVRSYLAGGDRLLDGSYRRDWMAVHAAQKAFSKG